MPALLQPAEQRQLAQGHGSGARLRARRVVRGRAGPPAPPTPGLGLRPARPAGGALASCAHRTAPDGPRRPTLGSPAAKASSPAPALPGNNARERRRGAIPRHARLSAARAHFTPCALGKGRAPPAHQTSCTSAFLGPLGTPRVAPPGASPILSRAPLSRASRRRSVPSAEPRGPGAGPALPRGRLRLPAVGSVRPAASGRSLHPSARPPPLSLPGPALTSRPARSGGGGRGAGAPGPPPSRRSSSPVPAPARTRLCARSPESPGPEQTLAPVRALGRAPWGHRPG